MKIMLVVLALPSLAFACPKGTVEYQGLCAATPAPDIGKDPQVNYASDEKPPRNNIPAWQRGDVIASTGTRARDGNYKQDYQNEKNQR